jgi:RHS repeat-associated protein
MVVFDYYPFGMPMPGRNFSANEYRYGFNGKEKDDEIKDVGVSYDYGMRMYDSRLGRFLSVDPISSRYPMLSSYQFASNNPIRGIDLDGYEFKNALKKFLEDQFEPYLQEASEEVVKALVQVVVSEIQTKVEKTKDEIVAAVESKTGKKLDLSDVSLQSIDLSGGVNVSFGVGTANFNIGFSGAINDEGDFLLGSFVSGGVELDQGLVEQGLGGFKKENFELGFAGKINVTLNFSENEATHESSFNTPSQTNLGLSANIFGTGVGLNLAIPNDTKDNSFSVTTSISLGAKVKSPLKLKAH